MTAVGLFSEARVFSEKSRSGLFFLISAVVPVVVVVVISQFTFIVDRYAFVTLPAWFILAGYGITGIAQRFGNKAGVVSLALLTVLAADAAGANLMYYQIDHGNRPEWRRAFQYVAGRMEEGDGIVSSVPSLGTYYTNRTVLPLDNLQPNQLLDGGQRTWFVLDSENSWFSAEQKGWVEDHADLLEIHYI